MTGSASNPHLRLVGWPDAAENARSPIDWLKRSESENERAMRIAAENFAARHHQPLSRTDPRWVVAVRAQLQLQGATLHPQARRRVMRTARQIGVRPFDANLIIALVQDRARRGETLHDLEPVLRLLPEAKTARFGSLDVLRWGIAIVCAILANVFLIWWLLGAR